VCAYHCVPLSYTTQHRTVLIIFPLIVQTIIIAQMMSTGREAVDRQDSGDCSTTTDTLHKFFPLHSLLPSRLSWWTSTQDRIFYAEWFLISVFSLFFRYGSETGDDGGGHWLVRMECLPAGWSVCLPLFIFPCTTKSRSSLLALAHPGGHGKGAVKQLWCGGMVWRWRMLCCWWEL